MINSTSLKTNTVPWVHQSKKFSVNWLDFCFFSVSFVYFGFGYGIVPGLSGLDTFRVLIIYFLAGFTAYHTNFLRREQFLKNYEISVVKVFSLLGIFLLLFLLNLVYIGQSPSGDELAYLSLANMNFTGLASSMLASLSPRDALRFLTVCFLSVWVFLYYLLNKIPAHFKFFYMSILSTIFLILHFKFSFFVGFGYVRGIALPIQIYQALFGLTPLGLQLGQTLFFSIFILLLIRFLRDSFEFSYHKILLTVGALASTPIIANSILVTDPSFYFLPFAAIPMLIIILKKKPSPIFLAILTVGTLIRFTLIIVFVCYAIYFIRSTWKQKNSILILVPFSLLLFVYALGWFLERPQTTGSYFEFDLESIGSRFMILFQSLEHAYSWSSILFIVIGACYFIIKSKVLGLVYIFCCWLAFFELTNPDIIGFPKYQLEWGSILVMMGSLAFLRQSFLMKHVSSILVAVVIVVNIFTNNNLGKLNSSADEMMQGGGPFALKYQNTIFAVSNFTYPYDSAFVYIRRTYSAQSCLNAPVSYGVMPEILAGMDWEYLNRANTLQARFISAQNQRKNGWTSFTPQDVADSGAQCLMVAATINKENVIGQLVADGWKIDIVLRDKNFNTRIFLLSR